MLNSHISAYTRCLAEKVCGLVRSTWGTSQGEDKLGATDKILHTKVARRACAGQTFPQRPMSSLMSVAPPGGHWSLRRQHVHMLMSYHGSLHKGKGPLSTRNQQHTARVLCGKTVFVLLPPPPRRRRKKKTTAFTIRVHFPSGFFRVEQASETVPSPSDTNQTDCTEQNRA